jgi:hypothetical protein
MPRGRKPIYQTDEERHEAKLRQTQESNRSNQLKRKELRALMDPQQIVITKIMSKQVLDKDQLDRINAILGERSSE